MECKIVRYESEMCGIARVCAQLCVVLVPGHSHGRCYAFTSASGSSVKKKFITMLLHPMYVDPKLCSLVETESAVSL